MAYNQGQGMVEDRKPIEGQVPMAFAMSGLSACGPFPNAMLQLAIALLVVISGSAFCSATETALLSLSLVKVRQLAQSRSPRALALLTIREKLADPLPALSFSTTFSISSAASGLDDWPLSNWAMLGWASFQGS